MRYKKSEEKRKERVKELEKLVYINHTLSNKELAKRLGISEKEFYRGNYNLIANELKTRYRKESLFN